jgi:DUF438 domain-containing protein
MEDSGGSPIPLRTGALTVEQINLMLAHLPFDVTFVDANDEVRFYSEGKGRVFERTPDIIGRSVLGCHPPYSVLQVNKILEDFHAGKRDAAEFWLQSKGETAEARFLHIRFFAVRDSSGRFQGTIEVAQDVTAIRKLEGERRLLAEGG